MDKLKYESEQKRLAKEIIISTKNIAIKEGDIIFTFDVQYLGEYGYVAVDVQKWKSDYIGVIVKKYKITEEYCAGYFAFSEGPLLLKAFNDIVNQKKIKPKLLIVDGHGTAHPREFGLACWLGLKCNTPSIGVAKNSLIQHDLEVGKEQGSVAKIVNRGVVVGYVLRTQSNIKPIFVSSGYIINQKQAVELICEIKGDFRIIEPIRRADKAARNFSKGEPIDNIVLKN